MLGHKVAEVSRVYFNPDRTPMRWTDACVALLRDHQRRVGLPLSTPRQDRSGEAFAEMPSVTTRARTRPALRLMR